MHFLKKLIVLVACIIIPSLSHAELSTGQVAPDFTLNDTKQAVQSLSQYKGKFVVLEWFNHGCPFVVKHYDSGNMPNLQKEYTAKGVVWLSINSSALGKEGNTTPQEADKLTASKKAAPTAVLLDTDGKVGRMYGAKTTPHMFIINPDGKLIYQGAIDDIASTDQADIAKANNYVKAALDQAMSGQDVASPTTKSYGCSVKY